MKYFGLILIILTAFLCSQNFALAGNKSDKLKPKWVTQALPEAQSGTYIFVRSHGVGSTLAGAKQMAFVSMSQKLEIERGLTVNTSVQSRERLYQNQKSSGSEYEQEIILDVTENGHKLKIVCREIDEYWTENSDKYDVDVLYTVTDKNSYGGSYNDDIKVSAKYGAGPGFLSIIPSVGQFYKGSVVKGSLILAGEIASAGGIILCENTRASYIKKMQEQPKYASEYNSMADSWETGRNVCIGAAAAIYVYNLIDAFVASGAKRVLVTNKINHFSAIPYADSRSSGICLTFNF
ncbi:MAG: hypothetical protein KBS80_06275 [Bacteroidales bacterium]|nr:hypothetical protein [Candidatus Cryptobacteroides choladohippi]